MRLDLTRVANPSISLTPLIDVVFILLLFFMLASDLNRFNGVELKASETSAGAQDQTSAIFLRVHADGRFSLVDERIDKTTLDYEISAYLDVNPAQAIVVHPDGDVRLQALIDVLDRLSELGVVSLTLG